MKDSIFIFRLFSLLIIIAALFSYNVVAKERQQRATENQQIIDRIEAYNDAVQDLETAQSEESTEVARKYVDGVYEGSGTGFGGEIRLSVTIQDDKITAVAILSAEGEDAAYLDMAKTLTDEIVQNQSVDIDTVSGATFSSRGILEAAKNALEKAVNP